ncbi:MAG: hypothetical protein ACRER4_00110 [Steroidobacteraceae bacterium]
MIPAAATATATAASDNALHAQHHQHDGMQDQVPAGAPAGAPTHKCCDGKACGCGCYAPPIATLQSRVMPGESTNSQVSTDFPTTFHVLGAVGAPFRPPA